jgi:hypothetical protein
MKTLPCMLAEEQVSDVLAQWRTLSGSMREGLIFFAALTLVAAVVFLWAMYFRRKRRRRREHSHSHRHAEASAREATAEESSDDSSAPAKRRKWRRPRREHRPRNPTLSETGGLPPVRQGEPPNGQP